VVIGGQNRCRPSADYAARAWKMLKTMGCNARPSRCRRPRRARVDSDSGTWRLCQRAVSGGVVGVGSFAAHSSSLGRMGCRRQLTMPQLSKRDPRAPRLGLNLKRPDVAEEVFVDEAVNEGLCLEGIRLADIHAEKVALKRFVLSEVDLTGAKLDGLDLENGSITGCSLANLRSQSCTFDRVVLEACRLTGSMLVEPRLIDVVFRGCPVDLSSFRFGRFNRVCFEGCRLTEVDLQGVTATSCTFMNCDLTGAQLSQGNFSGSAFRGCRLAGVNGLEALKGAQMAWEDVMELATALAASLGIDVRDDIA
jgi:uncharacterized protein YjbI with pentapeptide repeats